MEKEELVVYAYENTEFYREKYQSIIVPNQDWKWEDVPVVSKAEIAHAGFLALSSHYYAKLGNPEMISDYTSGSTGENLEVHTSVTEQKKALLSLWLYRKKFYKIDARSKLCYFYTFRSCKGDMPYEYSPNALGFAKSFLSSDNLECIYDRINQFQPEWMLLQPSIAMVLARYIFEMGLEPVSSVRYIELSGEMFTLQQKNFIQSAFEAVVASQYGCNEVGTIAYQCPYGNLHIMDQNVSVDVVNKGLLEGYEEYGNIAVTGKNNKVMPFIKYNTGDIGKICNTKCKCGHKGKILELLAARQNDIVRVDDEWISADVFKRIFQAMEWSIDGRIYQYRIVQKGNREFVVSIATDEEKEIVEKQFTYYVSSTKLAGCKYCFQFFDYILPDLKTGKLKFFIYDAD